MRNYKLQAPRTVSEICARRKMATTTKPMYDYFCRVARVKP
jgi:hypothetical protein